ncbi:hypothetical protein QQ045_016232 [Rhodiola kirilowii]
MMTLLGKLVSIQELRSDAATFYDLFTQNFHLISDTTHLINRCAVLEGPPATVGSILHCEFIHDERTKMAKQVIETIDAEKHSITLKTVEGDIMDEYKTKKMVLALG